MLLAQKKPPHPPKYPPTPSRLAKPAYEKQTQKVLLRQFWRHDVAFLLLVFFMVATTLQREKAISMKLPPAYDGPAQKVNEDEVLTLIINVDNDIMVEGDRVSEKYAEAITLHLKKLIHKNIKPIINIKMHPDSDYQTYLELLSSVRLTTSNIGINLLD